MPKRGENIRKRKDGRWEGRYKNGKTENGNTSYIYLYGKTYSEVKEKMLSLCETKQTTFNKNKSKTFSDVIFLWQEENKTKNKPATKTKYDYLIEKHIKPDLGNIAITEINTSLLNNYANDKLQNGRLDGKGNLSPSYVRSIMIIISSVMKFATEKDFCLPIKSKIYKPHIDKKELNVMRISTQKIYEKYLINNISPTNLGILISLYMGLRIGEICALTWDNVDFENKIIRVRNTIARVKNTNLTSSTKTILTVDSPKTKASIRDIPIPSNLLPLLIQIKIKKQKISPYVVSDNKTFISPRTYEYRYYKTLKECNIDLINYHVLRHTFATRCIEVGVDVKTLSELLGHANVSITLNTYVHSSIDLKRTQIEKLCV